MLSNSHQALPHNSSGTGNGELAQNVPNGAQGGHDQAGPANRSQENLGHYQDNQGYWTYGDANPPGQQVNDGHQAAYGNNQIDYTNQYYNDYD